MMKMRNFNLILFIVGFMVTVLPSYPMHKLRVKERQLNYSKEYKNNNKKIKKLW